MKVIFIRHGQTDYNLQHRLQGQEDLPLNETGIRQLEEVAAQLHQSFDLIFSSPYTRARQTAASLFNEWHNRS